MSFPKIFVIIVVVALVLIEGYLVISYAVDRTIQQQEVNAYCDAKCNFNPATSMWEFSGDYATKGFTTQNECYLYCSNVKQGFVSFLQNIGQYGTAFLGKIFSKNSGN